MSGSLFRRARLRWVVAGVLLALVLAVLEFHHLHRDPFWAEDLKVYEFGGSAVRSGNDPYAAKNSEGLFFTYPPFSAALFAPMSFLSTSVNGFLLILVSLLCLEGTLWYSFDLLGVREERYRAPLVLAATLALMWLDPVRETFRLGQVNLVLLLLVVADFARSGRRGHGALIGLAAAIKLTPAVFLLYLLVTRRTKAALTGLVVFLGTVVLTLLAFPGPTWDYFTKLVFDSSRVGVPQSSFSQSMRSALARLTHTTSGLDVPWIVAVLVIGTAGLWVAAYVERQGETLLAVTVVGIVGVLCCPISWHHHWVWVVPGFLVLLHALVTRARTLGSRAALAVAIAFLAVVFIVQPFEWVSFDAREDLHLSGMDQLYVNVYVFVGMISVVVPALFFRRGAQLAVDVPEPERESLRVAD